MSSVLCLDIDGTITTAKKDILNTLIDISNNNNTEIFINTARPQEYCENYWKHTGDFATKEKHKCFNGILDESNIVNSVSDSKVKNMNEIFQEMKHRKPNLQKSCVILVDDLLSNIKAVENAGFGGIHVHEEFGIDSNTIVEIKSKFELCSCINSSNTHNYESQSGVVTTTRRVDLE